VPDNQTRDEWLELPVIVANPQARGTGVVLYTHGKDFIADVEYRPFVRQMEADTNVRAYAWVPHAVMLPQQVVQAACSGLPCAGRCPPGCICDRQIGECQ
jgi:hypothetical protein